MPCNLPPKLHLYTRIGCWKLWWSMYWCAGGLKWTRTWVLCFVCDLWVHCSVFILWCVIGQRSLLFGLGDLGSIEDGKWECLQRPLLRWWWSIWGMGLLYVKVNENLKDVSPLSIYVSYGIFSRTVWYVFVIRVLFS